MKNKQFRNFYLGSCLVVLAASAYPIWMCVRVVGEMIRQGFVPLERYPKYIIPYVPIAIALILGVLLLPVLIKWLKKGAFPAAAVLGTGVFFLFERLMETKILVQAARRQIVILESWQLALCYVPPEEYQTRTWEAVDVLLGGYSPAFKLHFYLISLVLILSLLNCFYGIAQMLRSGDKRRKGFLIAQTIVSLLFLGMCIWACFTAFYRTGEITISATSAVLMTLFFILMGVAAGILVGSLTARKSRKWYVGLSAIVSSIITLAMYVGEMVLLRGNLYRFGKGFPFEGIPKLVLAPIDLAVIVLSGCITAGVCLLAGRTRKEL